MSATADAGPTPTFSKKTVFWGVLASLLAAAGFFLLATYAPDFRIGRQGGASPLSNSGAGYSGIAKLLSLNGYDPVMGRGPADELAYDASLMIVTISPEVNADIFKEIVKAREGLPTLFVLPKWQTAPLPNHDGWEMRLRTLEPYDVNRWLSQIGEFKLATSKPAGGDLSFAGSSVTAPENLQTIDGLNGLISSGARNAVFMELPERQFFILADPDLLNNQAMKDPARAKLAVDLLTTLAEDADGITFDLTLFGSGAKHDMFKLLVEPPFLALTLSVLGAAALAFFHGLGRFGPAQPEVRAIPFGKRALVDTTATLLRRAGRLNDMGGRYAALMRNRAGTLLGAPHGLQAEALDQWLETRNKVGEEEYVQLMQSLRTARTEAEVGIAARKLHQWIARRIGESR